MHSNSIGVIGVSESMNATATNEIGSGLWNVHIYAGLSLATELAAELDIPRSSVRSRFSDWKLNRKLERLNGFIEDLISGFDRGCMRHQGELPIQMSMECEYGPGANLVFRLHSVCAKILASRILNPKGALDHKKLARLQLLSNRLFDIFDFLLRLTAQNEMNADARQAEDMAEHAHEDAIAWDAAQWALPLENASRSTYSSMKMPYRKI